MRRRLPSTIGTWLVLLLVGAAEPAARAQESEEPRRSENPLTAPPPAPEQAPAGQLTRAPELLEFVQAPYPPGAEAQRLTGSVGLLVDLDAAGAVTAVEVTEPAGNGFDEAAIEAVRRFRFRPAEVDGAPAPVRIAYRYHFVLAPLEPARPQRASVVNFRGAVVQRGNREPVPHAEVSLDDGALGATADEAGRFELADVPAGSHHVVANAAGFERFVTDEEVVEGKVTEVTYYVRKRVFTPYETVVRGKREKKEVARVELEHEEIRLVPGTQGDAFKVVQNLPGVARAPYGFGLLIVRGGRPSDTRVYVDGVWIPNIFHFGGLTAVYNSDLLSDLTFLPGNFSSHTGRATGGVVEAETRAPSRDRFHGYLNASLLDTTALVEGPLGGAWSFAASGRVSYVDLVLREVVPATVSFLSAPRYYDYQVRAEWAPQGGADELRLMAFGAHDTMKVLLENPALVDPEGRSDLGGSIGFHRLVGTWTRKLSARARNKLTVALGTDTVTSTIGKDIRADGVVDALQLRDALALELGRAVALELGTDTYLGRVDGDAVTPGLPMLGEVPDPMASRQLVHMREQGTLFEPALYAELVLEPAEGLKLVPGVRLDYEHTLRFTTIDPRLSVFQQLGPTTLKGALGIYHQAPDFRAAQWTHDLGNPDLGPERSVQTMLGAEHRLTDALSVDVQLYYKKQSELAVQSTRTVVREGVEVLERWANEGEGRSYGVELLLRHELTRNFFGWIAYSLSRSEWRSPFRRNTGWTRWPFDQPHHLVALASYKWPGDWITGARLQYSSGNLQTPLTGSLYDSDADLHMPLPGAAFSERAPAFLSLDLRVDKRFVFQQWMLAVYLDVQNVTNNLNPELSLYNYDYSRRQYLRGLPIFPTLGVKAEF